MLPKQCLLAIDPGFDRLGWAIGQRQNKEIEVLDYGCIQTKRKIALFDRYRQILTDLQKIYQTHHPQELAIEQLFFSRNISTALPVSETRGLVIGFFLWQGVEVFEYHPNQIKLAVTGHGRADKRAVEKMVRWQFHLPKEKKIIDDAIDALAILLTHHLHRLRQDNCR